MEVPCCWRSVFHVCLVPFCPIRLLKDTVVQGSELDRMEVNLFGGHEGQKLSEFLYFYRSYRGSRSQILVHLRSFCFHFNRSDKPIINREILFLLDNRLKRYRTFNSLFFWGIMFDFSRKLVNIASNKVFFNNLQFSFVFVVFLLLVNNESISIFQCIFSSSIKILHYLWPFLRSFVLLDAF